MSIGQAGPSAAPTVADVGGRSGGARGTGPVITISASFGAGGSVIGPRLAARLGVPFVDRAIPETVAAEIGCSLEVAMQHDGRTVGGLGGMLVRASRLSDRGFGQLDVAGCDYGDPVLDEYRFVEQTERVIERLAASADGGVILGRAAACVLREWPAVLHVRLDGPAEARLARAERLRAQRSTADTGTVALRRVLADNDRARTAYVKHFYRDDPTDARLYHLVIDSTALPIAVCVDMLAAAARGRCGIR